MRVEMAEGGRELAQLEAVYERRLCAGVRGLDAAVSSAIVSSDADRLSRRKAKLIGRK